MSKYSVAFDMLKRSIVENDFPMLVLAVVTFGLFMMSCVFKRITNGTLKEWEKNKELFLSKIFVNGVGLIYTLFTTMITIFPLMGMLGTVCGLLGLDLANGDMDNIKNNFFLALTSTAWGIIFSMIFKVLNAFISDGVEEQIESIKKLTTVTKE